MESQWPKGRVVALMALLLYAIVVWCVPMLGAQLAVSPNVLEVHFFAVGQGDAILVETPEGNQVLIDGGPDTSVLEHLAATMPFFDRTLEVVVGTHPDLDHVAGLVDVATRYQIDTIITTEAIGASEAASAWTTLVPTVGAEVHYARAGQVYQLGASTTLTILSPEYNPAKLNSNAGSVVALLTFGDTAFLFTGDAPQGVEQYLTEKYGPVLRADVLKLGHHGSDTSSHPNFLTQVDPQYAVVSAGVANRYNHPDADVLARVAANTEAQIVSTQHGTVRFGSDGRTVWIME